MNLDFTKEPLIHSTMDQTFYVDATNGDDNNNGSSTNPFKTIKKACDSVPVGGVGLIYLINGQTYNMPIDDDIVLKNKIIQFLAKDFDSDDPDYSSTNPPKIFITKKNNGTSSKFLMINSVLYIGGFGRGILIEDDSSLGFDAFLWAYIDLNNANTGINSDNYFVVSNSQIKLNKVYLGNNIMKVFLKKSKIVVDTSNISYLFNILWCNFAVSEITLNDTSGNNLDIKNYVSGIVKDSNGVTRNIISNIVF